MRSRRSRRRRLRRARATGEASGPLDRATAGARRPRRPRAPGQTGRRVGRRVPRRPARTRVDIRPRRRPGTRGCRGGARRGTDTTSGGGSRLDDDEALILEEHPAADLDSEHLRLEVALVHLPPGAVAQGALFAVCRLDAFPANGRDDDDLRRHAPRFAEKAQPLLLFEVAVEVAREDALEGAVLERQGKRVTLEEAGARNA